VLIIARHEIKYTIKVAAPSEMSVKPAKAHGVKIHYIYSAHLLLLFLGDCIASGYKHNIGESFFTAVIFP
jgi:hypothetical protein